VLVAVKTETTQFHVGHRRDGAALQLIGTLAAGRGEFLEHPRPQLVGEDRVAAAIGELARRQDRRRPVGALQIFWHGDAETRLDGVFEAAAFTVVAHPV